MQFRILMWCFLGFCLVCLFYLFVALMRMSNFIHIFCYLKCCIWARGVVLCHAMLCYAIPINVNTNANVHSHRWIPWTYFDWSRHRKFSKCQAFELSSCIKSDCITKNQPVFDVKRSEQQVKSVKAFELIFESRSHSCGCFSCVFNFTVNNKWVLRYKSTYLVIHQNKSI